MRDRLADTRPMDDVCVEIYERSALIPNPAIGMIPTRMVVETFYVMPAPDWPKVRIRARRWRARLLYRLGRRPGVALEDARFNLAFRVDCEDEGFALLLLNPPLQEFLLKKASVDWSAGGGAIKLFYRGRLRRKKIDHSIARLRRFRDLLDQELFTFGV